MADLRSIAWRIWYDHNRVFTSKDAIWEELPDDGAQVLNIYYENGNCMTVSGQDWLFRAPHRSGDYIYAGSTDSKEETMARFPGAILKRCRWTTVQEIDDIQTVAAQTTKAP